MAGKQEAVLVPSIFFLISLSLRVYVCELLSNKISEFLYNTRKVTQYHKYRNFQNQASCLEKRPNWISGPTYAYSREPDFEPNNSEGCSNDIHLCIKIEFVCIRMRRKQRDSTVQRNEVCKRILGKKTRCQIPDVSLGSLLLGLSILF